MLDKYRINLIPKLFFSYINERLKETKISGMYCPYIIALGSNQGINMAEITRCVHLDKANTSRMIGELEKLDIVKVKESNEDRRMKIVYLTEEGLGYLELIKRIKKEWESSLFAEFNEEELKQVESISAKLVNNAIKALDAIKKIDSEEQND